jgi:hypothetical protein
MVSDSHVSQWCQWRGPTYIFQAEESISAVIAQGAGILQHLLKGGDFWRRLLGHLLLSGDICGSRGLERDEGSERHGIGRDDVDDVGEKRRDVRFQRS